MKKVIFRGRSYPLIGQGEWTYNEGEIAQRVAGITVGQMALGIITGDVRAAKGFGAVALIRAGADVDVDEIGNWPLDDLIVDFTGDVPDPEEETADDPPAEAADVEADAAAATEAEAG